MNTRSFCTKTKHWITLLQFLCAIRLRGGWFCEKTVNRITATGAGSFMEISTFFAAWDLGR